jgi:hypothetical protein
MKNKHKLTEVRLQVLKAVRMKITVFRNVMLSSLAEKFVTHASWLTIVALNNLQAHPTHPDSSIRSYIR